MTALHGNTTLQFKLIPSLWLWPFSTCTRYPSIFTHAGNAEARANGRCLGHGELRSGLWSWAWIASPEPLTCFRFLLTIWGGPERVANTSLAIALLVTSATECFAFQSFSWSLPWCFYLLIPYSIGIRFQVKQNISRRLFFCNLMDCVAAMLRDRLEAFAALWAHAASLGSNQGGRGETSFQECMLDNSKLKIFLVNQSIPSNPK